MLKLIKYEFIKKSKLLLILLVTAIIANIALCIGFKEGGTIIFLSVSIIALGIIYLCELIKTYSDDINKKTGYMLFMTPNSGYKIIGSKLITVILEGAIYFISYMLLCFGNGIYIMFRATGNFSFIGEGFFKVIEAINQLLSGSIGITIGDLTLIFVQVIMSAIVFILTVYTAITIRKSIFSNIKGGGILSFLIFVVLNILNQTLFRVVGNAFDFGTVIIHIDNVASTIYPSMLMLKIFSVSIIYNIVISVALVLGSGYLLEKKINL